MESINKILKLIIISVFALILTIILASHIGIIWSSIIIFSLFFIIYFLNKKYIIKNNTDIIKLNKNNIIIPIILFFIAFTIRIILVNLLKISPQSDFALLINASKQLSNRKKYIEYILLFLMLGISDWICIIPNFNY